MPGRCEEDAVPAGQDGPLDEYEELKEGIWLEPALALQRKKTKEGFWKEVGCRRNSSTLVGRMKENVKLVAKRRRRKAQAVPLPRIVRSRTGDSRVFQKVGAKSKNLKERVEVAKRYCDAPSQ